MNNSKLIDVFNSLTNKEIRDLEHFIRDLLLQGEISYNLDSRVLNYSMGLPRVESPESEGKYQLES